MEAFSTATGLAGLISLGLTVSGGLIQYCKDYQSQDTNLTELSQHANDLKSFLTLIKTRTTGSQSLNNDIDTSLRRCRDACEACLQDFKRLNDRYAGPHLGRRRKLVYNLKYPFNKSEFEHVRSRLRDFNVQLLEYLQLVNLDVTRDIRAQIDIKSDRVATAIDAMGTQFQSSLLTMNHSVHTSIQVGVDQLKVSIQHGLQKTEGIAATSMEQQTSIIMHRLDQVVQMLQNQNSNQASSFIDNRIIEATPGINTADRYKSAEAQAPALTVPIRSILCDCPRPRHGGITRHRKGCPYSFSNRRKQTFTFKLNAFRRQIIAICQIEYSLLTWGRGWKIHSNLNFRATVQQDAPAFKVMDRANDAAREPGITLKDVVIKFENCLVELQHIFASGCGWPTDTNEEGENLLHRGVEFFRIVINQSNEGFNEEAATIVKQFITSLVDMGVPINDISNDKVTPLHAFLRHFSWDHSQTTGTYIADALLDMDAVVGDRLRAPTVLNSILTLNVSGLYESLGCTELHYEILLRSEFGVINLLQSHSTLCDLTQDGQTSLHLAPNWPRGLSIMIKHGGESFQRILNIRDRFGWTALQYAIWLGNPESVSLLVDAGADITADIFWLPGFNTSTTNGQMIADIICGSYGSMIKKLLSIAFENLSPEMIEEFGLQDNTLDYNAFDVAEALRKQQIALPIIYNALQPGSVYHLPGIESDTAQRLFDIGFHRTNTELEGYTPLMMRHRSTYASYLRLVSWFIDHGADLYASIPIPKRHTSAPDAEAKLPTYPTIHVIAHTLGIILPFQQTPNLSTRDIYTFSKLLTDEIEDPCLCYCTTNGCTSASKYAQGLYRRSIGYDIGSMVSKGLRLVENSLTGYNGYDMSLSLIRVMTFEMLGMRHTCCSYSPYWGPTDIIEDGLLHLMDLTEVDEIREEDRYLAILLELLMKEFEAKLQELKVMLSEFVEVYWSPRMRDVEMERDELSTDDLQSIREAGVVLEET